MMGIQLPSSCTADFVYRRPPATRSNRNELARSMRRLFLRDTLFSRVFCNYIIVAFGGTVAVQTELTVLHVRSCDRAATARPVDKPIFEDFIL